MYPGVGGSWLHPIEPRVLAANAAQQARIRSRRRAAVVEDLLGACDWGWHMTSGLREGNHLRSEEPPEAIETES
jgi:hypothetical protein